MEFYKTYSGEQKKRAGIYLLICTAIILAELAGVVLVKSDAGFVFACLLELWGMLEIGLLLMWLEHRNWYMSMKNNMVAYRNLFGVKKEFSITKVTEVFVNQYGKIRFQGEDGKAILSKNISGIPGIAELTLALKEKGIPFVFKSEEMRIPFILGLENLEEHSK